MHRFVTCAFAHPRRPWLQVEMKMMVAAVVSRMHVTLDARMAHLRSVEDYVATTATRLTLQTEGPTWLRMRPHTAAT